MGVGLADVTAPLAPGDPTGAAQAATTSSTNTTSRKSPTRDPRGRGKLT